MKRKTEKEYHNLAKSCGFKWVGRVLPKNVCTKTWWECKEGHRWESKYNDIDNNYGCPHCAGNAKKTESDYRALATERGFKWVGVFPKNTRYKTLWECKKRHRWLASYSGLCGCPICNKKTKEDYQVLAESRDFVWVGPFPKSVMCKTWWKCKKCCYKWETNYGSTYNGNGCPFCANKVPKVKRDYCVLAEKRVFKWISETLPKNTMTKTVWECCKGHTWKATYNNIAKGTGCPYCDDRVNGVSVSKPQRKLNGLLFGSLNYPEGKYRIDVAIMRRSQKIAVEYDCQYWHEGNEEHDAKRDKYLTKKGWKVLHIKSSHLLPTRKQFTSAIGYLLNTNNRVFSLYLEDWE
jgi:very-short-patch-repair endonuclease